MEKKKVFIGVPVYKWTNKPSVFDSPHPRFKHSLQRLLADDRLETVFAPVIGDADIERARACLLMNYLRYEMQWDYFLQLDWDIEFEPDDLVRAIERMEKTGKRCVGGPYAFKTEDEGKKDVPVYRCMEGCTPTSDHYLKCAYIGGGYTLCSDSLVRDLCAANEDLRFNVNHDIHSERLITYSLWAHIIIPRPDWGEGNRELLSEDYSFCQRILNLGEDIWLDLTIRLKHWNGDKAFVLPMKEEKTDDGGQRELGTVEDAPHHPEGADPLGETKAAGG